MAKRALFLSILVAALALALTGPAEVSGKGHVPPGRSQVCTANGVVKNIASKQLGRLLDQGACRLPVCAFNDEDSEGNVVKKYIFRPGETCQAWDNDEDGFCDITGAPDDIPRRLNAVNKRPFCSEPF